MIDRGERLFANYGSATIFFARFIAGMRIVAGPLAGVLRMKWGRFALFNFLGAIVWVSVITAIGYIFGEHWNRLLHFMSRVNLVLFLIALVVGWVAWRRYRARQLTQRASAAKEGRSE